MKRFIFLQMFFVLFLTISCETPSYGASDFSKHYNKGIEFYKQGKYDQAGKAFEEAIKIKPNDVYALYGLGNTYYCKAKYDEAVKIYSRAIKINPEYAKVHYSLSLAYSKLGMTREAEKQKTMFRKLSQGGKSTGSSTHAKASHTSSHAKVEHAPKKTLPHAPKRSLHAASGHETKTHDTHAASRHETKTHDTHAASKHETKTHDTHAASKHETKTHDTHAASRHDSGVDSHSIFKGYTGETKKADKRIFTKKYKETYGISKGPYGGIKLFIQNKWYESRINKILICTAGYILATQIWLCVVTLFTLVIWRIRENT